MRLEHKPGDLMLPARDLAKRRYATARENAVGSRPRGELVSRVIRRPEFGALISFIAVYVFFLAFTHENNFASLSGMASWMNSAAEIGIVAVPVGLLMIAGEFDLSVGAMAGTSSILVSICVTLYNWPFWAASAAALVVGAAVGFGNGLIRIKTQIPSFIVTLATWFVLAGASLGISRTITGTTAVSLTITGFAKSLFAAKWKQFNVSILWWLAGAIAGTWILTRTRAGNWIVGTGGNVEVARGSGVPTNRVKIALFMGTAVASSLVGILDAVEFNGGNLTNGQNLVFDSLIAVIVGGTLFQGGYGSVPGIFLGAATYGLVAVGVLYTGWDTDYAELFLGVLLLGAFLGNSRFRRLVMTARKAQSRRAARPE